MAREVEHMTDGATGLIPHPFPVAIITSRRSAHAGTVRSLLEWKLSEGPTEERAMRYSQAEALFGFLW
jgi:hypothetical protein